MTAMTKTLTGNMHSMAYHRTFFWQYKQMKFLTLFRYTFKADICLEFHFTDAADN